MPNHTCTILRFPPLVPLALPTARSLPSVDELRMLQHYIDKDLQNISQLQTILSIRPGPGLSRLRRASFKPLVRDVVLSQLIGMQYPADLIDWFDTARSLARKTSRELDGCFQAIEQLKGLSPNTSAYQEVLNVAQQTSTYAFHFSGQLSKLFEELIQDLKLYA